MTNTPQGKTFGFIIPTHIKFASVLSHVVNNIVSILRLYPEQRVILINDGSTLIDWQSRLFAGINSKNVETCMISVIDVPSDSVGKGEMNPYYYFYHNKFFDYAVILNDGCTAVNKLPEVDFDFKYMWWFHYHHGWDKSPCPPREDHPEIKTHEDEIIFLLNQVKNKILGQKLIDAYHNKSKWVCCYASISVISHEYLVQLQDKAKFIELYDYIHNRRDRMALESLLGVYNYFVSGRLPNFDIQNFMGNQVRDNESASKPHLEDTHPRGWYQKVYGQYFTKTSWGR
jgi:hypothetical protein